MHVEWMDAVKWLEIRRGLQSLLLRHGRHRSRGFGVTKQTKLCSCIKCNPTQKRTRTTTPSRRTPPHSARYIFLECMCSIENNRAARAHRDTEDAHRGAGALQVKSLVKSLHARGSRGERRNGSRRLRSRGELLLRCSVCSNNTTVDRKSQRLPPPYMRCFADPAGSVCRTDDEPKPGERGFSLAATLSLMDPSLGVYVPGAK